MSVQVNVNKGRVPVKIWTEDIGRCIDEAQAVWGMLHSGSRGIGNVIGRCFIAAAKKDMQRHQVNLPDRDLAYFAADSLLFDDYVEAVDWAQNYAMLNRREMMRLIVDTPAGSTWRNKRAASSAERMAACSMEYPRVQGHRRGDGKPARSTRSGSYPQAGLVRERIAE